MNRISPTRRTPIIGKSLISILLIGAILCIPRLTATRAQGSPQAPPAPTAFKWLGWGEVKPEGWIRQQMFRDLKSGFAGHLNELCPEASSDIFVTGRNGHKQANTNNAIHCQWWNGETEGNWRTGFILMAYLSGDRDAMAKADAFVAHILASQDTDGYLGINEPEFRYKTAGELWTQTCLLRGLLDYAELTGRKDVLAAVERAAHCTIEAVTAAGAIQWDEPHDLMFCDVLERLYDLTGDTAYPGFGLWLFDSYCKARPHDDIALTELLDIYGGMVGHGAHAYEHLRVPLWLWSVTGRKNLDTAWRNGVEKINRYSYPGGAAVSQEEISDCVPDPTFTEFEYCAAKELQWSMESALQKTGETRFADRTELMWFNDEQGNRLADGSALTYLTNENRLQLDGRAPNELAIQPRNRFSPTQKQVAVCCPPNATQVAALYVHGMWMRQGDGDLAALLYGPCAVSTKVRETGIHITEETAYPFSNSVLIRLQPDQPVEMTLVLRNPAWSQETTVTCDGAQLSRDGMYWRVHKTWKPGDTVQINFTPQVRTITAVNGEVALQYGALLFAKPIPSKEDVIAGYPVKGFKDLYYQPAEKPENNLALPRLESGNQWSGILDYAVKPLGSAPFEPFKAVLVKTDANLLDPFDSPVIALEGTMVDTAAQNAPCLVTLVPLGNADKLRRVTFPIFHYIDQQPPKAKPAG